jgi:uncharacterized protein (DUF952 family)
MSRQIYKILTPDEWSVLDETGEFLGTQLDLKDGFVHLSYLEQINDTISKYFKGHKYLFVVEFDAKDYDTRVENGFPHIYGSPLKKSNITSYDTRELV